MNINLNQTLLSLGDAYHAGKLSKDEYRIQRSIEFDRLSVQAEKLSKKHVSHTSSRPFSNKEKRKKHITVSVVLFIISIFIVVVVLA